MNSTTHHSNHDMELQRQRLEALIQPTAHSKSRRAAIAPTLKALGGRLVRFLTAENDLRLWQRTRQGQTVWFAYDPLTNQKHQFLSEPDLRSWLENRYNQ
jgi:hypothetical protein